LILFSNPTKAPQSIGNSYETEPFIAKHTVMDSKLPQIGR